MDKRSKYVEYRRLGRAGMWVSTISLGSWLTYGGAVQDSTAIACIRRAYDLGVNLFDTANQYRKGDAERVVGRALKDFRRDSYVLATKVFFPLEDGPNDHGLSRKHIMEQCHASLRRLGVEYIDLYQCHRYDPDTPLEETLRALDDLVTQGKVLYIGVSEWSATQIADALYTARLLNLDGIVSNQPIYNMLNRLLYRARHRTAVHERGCWSDRFLSAGAGRAHRQVSTGKTAESGYPSHGSRVEHVYARLIVRDYSGEGRALEGFGRRSGLFACPNGPGLGIAPAECRFGDYRRLTTGTSG